MVSDTQQQQQPSGMQQPQQLQKPPQVDSQFIKAFVAGGGAGMLAALITCPVEVVKTKLQAFSPSSPPVSPLLLASHASTTALACTHHCPSFQSRSVAQQASSTLTSVTRRIYANEGFRGFFRGVRKTCALCCWCCRSLPLPHPSPFACRS